MANDVTVKIGLNEDTEFYGHCYKCGREVDVTEDIFGDFFSEVLTNSQSIICDECAEKLEAQDIMATCPFRKCDHEK